MQTVSLARRTCMAVESAVECTATVLIPISWQARWMRSAISPRLAISTFSNMREPCRGSLDQHQWRAVFNRPGILDKDARDPAGARRTDLVHYLHRFDDQHRLAFADLVADADERRGAGLRSKISDADNRRGEGAARRCSVERWRMIGAILDRPVRRGWSSAL